MHPLFVAEHPAAVDVERVEEELHAFNREVTGFVDYRPLGIFVRDEHGRIVAGLTGGIWGGCCEIRYLWVHEDLRGQGYGSRLVRAAEQEASAHGCSAIVVSSHSFQAPEFYRKLGYEVVGVAEGYPRGHSLVYLRKTIAASDH